MANLSSSLSERRVLFTMGDFIEYANANSYRRIVRLDYLFVREQRGSFRLFAVVRNMTEINRVDPILHLPLMRLSEERGFARFSRIGARIVGLPAITAAKYYVVPVEMKEGHMVLSKVV